MGLERCPLLSQCGQLLAWVPGAVPPLGPLCTGVLQGLMGEAAEHPSRPRRGFGRQRVTHGVPGSHCRWTCFAARRRFCRILMSSHCRQCSLMMSSDWRSGRCKEKSCGRRQLSKSNLKRGRAADADGDDLERALRVFPQLLHSAPSMPLSRASRSHWRRQCQMRHLSSPRFSAQFTLLKPIGGPAVMRPMKDLASSTKNAQVKRTASVEPTCVRVKGRASVSGVQPKRHRWPSNLHVSKHCS